METNLHQTNEVIGDRYQILSPLGSGGSGTTYAALDLQTQHQVALKVVSLRHIKEWKTLELFDREAKILKNLNHPQIPSYLDYFSMEGADDQRFYLVQELAEGESLDRWVEKGWRADEATAKDIAIQVLHILDYLHGLNPPVVHRDIKPQNIVRSADNYIYLVDFGSVQDLYRQTFAKTFVGTFGYMPPEQFRGQCVCVSDLYSLGATILFVLTHRAPSDFPQKRMRLNFRPYLTVSEKMQDWLDGMLEPAVEDRFPSARAAIDFWETNVIPVRREVQYSRIVKPKGTRIELERKPNRLFIRIPPLFRLWVNLAPFLVFFIFIGTTRLLLLNVFAFIIFLVIIFFINFLELYLELDRQRFYLRWGVFGKYLVITKGITADIATLERIEGGNNGYQKSSVCAIWEGVKCHRFGRGLLSVEQTWLLAEIQDFLNSLKTS
jgi:serine/threonine protein kinase